MNRLVGIRSATAAAAATAATLLASGLLAAGCGSSSSSSGTTNYPASTAASTPATSASSTTAAGSTSSTAPAGSGTAPSGAVQVLKLAADPNGALSYNTTTLTAHPGKVTIEFTNMAPLEHNVTVESSAGAKLGATPTFSGGTKSLTLELKAGTYSFFCTVPGHKQAGMQGTLTVQ